MKKLLVLALALVVIGAVSYAYADFADNAVAHVWVKVNPNIAVSAIDEQVNMQTIQSDDITWPITFRIDANTESVGISGLVTKLYKGDDPTGTEVLPIPVNTSAGLRIDPTNANEVADGDGIAAYVGTGSYLGFAGELSEALTFESSQDGHFSQDVEVSPTWSNTDEEKPQGQYSGFVVLYATIYGAPASPGV